jgi:hypothetical protein
MKPKFRIIAPGVKWDTDQLRPHKPCTKCGLSTAGRNNGITVCARCIMRHIGGPLRDLAIRQGH